MNSRSISNALGGSTAAVRCSPADLTSGSRRSRTPKSTVSLGTTSGRQTCRTSDLLDLWLSIRRAFLCLKSTPMIAAASYSNFSTGSFYDYFRRGRAAKTGVYFVQATADRTSSSPADKSSKAAVRPCDIPSQCCGQPRVASKVCPWYRVPRRVALAATERHPLSRSGNPVDSRFWDIIHDGGVDAITGSVPGEVVLTVGIEDLCRQLATAANTLLASLRGCSLLSYTPYGEPPISDLQQIAARDVEVLSAVVEPDRVSVCCVGGTLDVAYRSVEVKTMEGVAVTQEELDAAANRSVAEWLATNRRGQAAG